ncbi:hypothetical protein A1O1_08903 [Capronia coronata CBS 617.96]|uniref:Uncharacterized protein n=1 Tax=Capronia coronata CBS 617.96 TaxID=1182541 RepID=W9XDF6_9EURO|nr:uncharacterized protein A1O1_08903 [Capronia coronata CBS 617.96]EXJ78502.1 hypothetical protein A1O1_08903 [Capronia coronata CBS 617.96]
MASSRLADLFEEFCRPPSATSFSPLGASNNAQQAQQQQHHHHHQPNGAGGDGSGMAQLPGHFMPFEEIALPPHLMPLNPEDEDDVVPDMHAAFGINRALGQNQAGGAGAARGVGGSGGATGAAEPGGEASNAGVQREPVWRDFGLSGIVAGVRSSGIGERPGPRREGKKTGVLLLR